MFEFGRELRRIFRNQGRVDTDPSLYELLNLKLLITQGRALDIEGGRVSTKLCLQSRPVRNIIARQALIRTPADQLG